MLIKPRILKRLLLLAMLAVLSLLVALPAAAGNTILTSPVGGESWTQGSSQKITWTPFPSVFPTDISLYASYDSGATWTAIASGLAPSDGQYAWTVPDLTTSKARIKLVAITDMPHPIPDSKTIEESEDFSIVLNTVLPHLPFDPHLPILTPGVPSNLDASATSSSAIALSWEDKSTNESGFKIERKSSGDFAEIATVAADVEAFQDINLDSATSYTYRVRAYNGFGNSNYSNETTAKTKSTIVIPHDPDLDLPDFKTTVMKFYIGSSDYYVGDEIKSMDTVPQILESRTVLPIRYVAQPLGATVDWNDSEQKVTVSMGSKIIILFINNNIAIVDGVPKAVDPDNMNVKPVIMPPGRTMLPLRFIAEELGCKVEWNASTQEIKITYPKDA